MENNDSNKSYTLLIYNYVDGPIDNILYLIPNEEITQEHLDVLNKCAGKFVNHTTMSDSEYKAMNQIDCAINTTEIAFSEYSEQDQLGYLSSWEAIWNKYKQSSFSIKNTNITNVFYLGFVV